jgi:glutamate synthase (NADPH/NADH) small chain
VEFVGDHDGNLQGLQLVDVKMADGRFVPVDGSEREVPAQLVTLAMGFLGPQHEGLLDELGVGYDPRGNVARDESFATSVDGVFVAGDMGRGQSLIVWAIAEGRAAAAGVDAYLTNRKVLPAPIAPTDRSMA